MLTRLVFFPFIDIKTIELEIPFINLVLQDLLLHLFSFFKITPKFSSAEPTIGP